MMVMLSPLAFGQIWIFSFKFFPHTLWKRIIDQRSCQLPNVAIASVVAWAIRPRSYAMELFVEYIGKPWRPREELWRNICGQDCLKFVSRADSSIAGGIVYEAIDTDLEQSTNDEGGMIGYRHLCLCQNVRAPGTKVNITDKGKEISEIATGGLPPLSQKFYGSQYAQ